MKIVIPMLLLANVSQAETRTKIAVIDTGVSHNQFLQPYMCSSGVRNLTKYGKSDAHGHGSHIVHIIGSRIDTSKYCIVSFKVWHDMSSSSTSMKDTIKALNVINKESNFKYINISMSGGAKDRLEYKLLKQLTEKNIKISVSAGNETTYLSSNIKKCDTYPACYKLRLNNNFYVVQAHDLKYSNYGSFTVKERGKNIKSYGGKLSGSSQAAALYTSKLINK